jgi:hypothetical protein
MAQRGRTKAATLMGGRLVTDFILRMTLGQEPPRGWPFPDHVFRQPTRAALWEP